MTTDPWRARLEARRQQTLERIGALRCDVDAMITQVQQDPPDDEHDPDGATVGYERAKAQALAARAVADLAEVEAALDRIDQGTYGRCERCGDPIPAERLEARPAARTCVGCAGG